MTATQNRTVRYVIAVRHGRVDDFTTGRGGRSFAHVVDTSTGLDVPGYAYSSDLGVDVFRTLAQRAADGFNTGTITVPRGDA